MSQKETYASGFGASQDPRRQLMESWERPRSHSFISKHSVSTNSPHSSDDLLSPTLTVQSMAKGGEGDQLSAQRTGAAIAERLWPSDQESGGHRTEPTIARGIYSSAGAGASQWLLAIQVILQHEFKNPDLLEEALESPDSGVSCVGKSHRHFADGNRGLANVGDLVMNLVLKDQCYLFAIPDGEAASITDRLIGWKNLARIAWETKIEKFVRRKKPLRPAMRKNPLSLMKDDVSREDPMRTAARAMRAIVGAVYYDGGLPASRRVMAELTLTIKPGE